MVNNLSMDNMWLIEFGTPHQDHDPSNAEHSFADGGSATHQKMRNFVIG